MKTFSVENDTLHPTAIGFSYFYAIMMLLNIILNSILMFVAKKAKLLNNTPNVLIVNLAIADIGLAIANFPIWASNAVAGYWVTKQFGCYWNGFACSYFVFNTVITLFFTTAERYFSIVLQKKVDKVLVIKLLSVCWIAGAAYACLPLLSSAQYMAQASGTYCAPDWSSNEPSAAILKIVICSMISSTVVLMVFGYYRIISVFRSAQASFKTKASTTTTTTTTGTASTVTIKPVPKSTIATSTPPTHSSATSSPKPPSSTLNASTTKAPTTLQSMISPTLLASTISPQASLNGSTPNQSTNSKKLSLSLSNTPLLKSLNASKSKPQPTLTPSQITARKNEKMLLVRAIAVVSTFILCWCMYLAVWGLTWVSSDPVPLLVDCISAFLVSLIGVMNPLLTFVLDKRYNSFLLNLMGIKSTAGTPTPNKGLESSTTKTASRMTKS